jgi:hypothetical protein
MKNAKINSNDLLDKLRGGLDSDAYHLVWMAIADLICGAKTCGNKARYSSGYCGICDLILNQGKGKRR